MLRTEPTTIFRMTCYLQRGDLRLCILLLCSFLLLPVLGIAQRSKIETITIGLDQKGHAETEWPFDVPFYITGGVTDDVLEVIFNYRIHSATIRDKNWISFPKPSATGKNGYLKEPKRWKPGIGTPTHFVMLCEGLHPNVKYNFKFTLIRKVKLEAKLVEEMRKKLAERLKDFFKRKADVAISPTDLATENQALTAIILGYFPGKDLYKKEAVSEKYVLNAFDQGASADIAQAQIPILHDANTIFKAQRNILINQFNTVTVPLLSDIDSIQKAKAKLNGYSKEILALPFNPGLADFKAYTLLDGIKLLRLISLRPVILEQLFNGKLRIHNNSFIDGPGEPDAQSILFLSSVLQELSNGVIKDSVKVKVVERVGGKDRTKIVLQERNLFTYFPDDMRTAFEKIRVNILKIADAKEKLKLVEEKLPDHLSTIVQVESVESIILPAVDVISEKTPYISAEAGIAYVPAFQSAAHYRGANIYFSPVDKRAPLSSFYGLNRILKSLSVQIGAFNYFGDRAVNSYSLLGKTSNVDLSLALGWRLNRIIKINGGVVPYKTNNFNSIGDKTRLRGAGYISVGLDVNLLKAFGDVATKLSL